MIQSLEPKTFAESSRSWRLPRVTGDVSRIARGAVSRVRGAAVKPASQVVGSGHLETVTVGVAGSDDVARARRYATAFAAQSGFADGDRIVIDAVVTELATNIVRFAGAGELVFGTESANGRTGMVIVAQDRGPGIPDVRRAMVDGFSTSGRPGLGLATANRLMDAFEVASAPGQGTTVTMTKWRTGSD